jgi:hypothetical protein
MNVNNQFRDKAVAPTISIIKYNDIIYRPGLAGIKNPFPSIMRGLNVRADRLADNLDGVEDKEVSPKNTSQT